MPKVTPSCRQFNQAVRKHVCPCGGSAFVEAGASADLPRPRPRGWLHRVHVVDLVGFSWRMPSTLPGQAVDYNGSLGVGYPPKRRLQCGQVVSVDRSEVIQAEHAEPGIELGWLDGNAGTAQLLDQVLKAAAGGEPPKVVTQSAHCGRMESPLSLSTITTGRRAVKRLLSASQAGPPVSAPSPTTTTTGRCCPASSKARLRPSA
jgi:hypothetical protein